MLTLMIDTAGATGGVLLARSESAESDPEELSVLGSRDLRSGQFSAQLIPAIAELLIAHNAALSDVDLFAIVSGPGPFTGLRVGISAVKALAEAMTKPIVTVSRLAVAASVFAMSDAHETEAVHVVLDAGRSELYHGIYRNAGWSCVQESLQTREGLSARINMHPGVLITPDASVCAALAGLQPILIPLFGVHQALPLAWRSWRAGRMADVLTLDANYLRSSDAEISARLAAHALQRKSAETTASTGTAQE